MTNRVTLPGGTRIETTLVPAPLPRTTVTDEWCHKTRNKQSTLTYCGQAISPDEPFCGEFIHSTIGTCSECGRLYCPDCVAATRFGLSKPL